MEKFVIERVQIEGFKGFTVTKEVDLKGKHVFLFGDNGNGKTSILEAIRWCLCGGEGEEALRNDFYGGACQVELFLRKGDGVYRVQRSLRRGSGKSDAVVFTPDGKEHTLSEVFPALPRLFSEEGIYIVLAEQSPSWRRPPTDVSEFGRVIYAYLGWDELRELLEKLAKVASEYEEVGRGLAADLEKVETAGRERLKGVQENLKRLVSNPPWEGNPPTYADTRQKIENLVNRLTQQSGASPVTFTSPEMMLRHAESLLKEIQSRGEQPLGEKARRLQQDIDTIQSLQAQWERAQARLFQVNKECDEVEKELAQVCQGKSPKELEEDLRRLEEEVRTQALREDVLQKTLGLLDQDGMGCPVCTQQCPNLKVRIQSALQEVADTQKTLLASRDQAERRLNNARNLSMKKTELMADRDSTVKEIDRLARELGNLLALENVTPEGIEEGLRRMREELSNLRERANNLSRWVQDRQGEIGKLREELGFHALRDQMAKLEAWLVHGLQKAQDAYQSFGDVLDSINEIRDKIYQVLEQELEMVLPPLSEQMSHVYQRLTKQKSYDRVKLTLAQGQEGKKPGAPKIEVKVYSTRFPDLLFDPTTRLNGQALRALYLVPYFVFSGAKAHISGLDLLMLDDPSQRFDTVRLSALLSELKEVASHSQLIVATHERERFEALLPSAFPPDSYVVINVKGFDPAAGPSFEPVII